MTLPVITIEEIPNTPEGRARRWLRGRKLMIAGGLAVAEVVLYLAYGPGRLLGLLLVVAALALFIALAGRVRPGLARDLLQIGALAQGMVVALPILAGVVSMVVAGILMLALIALFVVIGLRFRR